MATPRKLKSGRWNVQVFTHRDEKGNPHFKSITADSKKECALLAAKFQYSKQRHESSNITVEEAVENYISSKEKILSPTTVKAYRSMLRNGFKKIANIRVNALTNKTVQSWINDLSEKLSAKSLANHYGLFSSSMSALKMSFNVRLPQRKIYNAVIPSDDEVKRIIEHFVNANDIDMANAVRLAAYGTLRRSEVCGLRKDAVDRVNSVIHVMRVEVINTDGDIILKEVPKTSSSDRFVTMPPDIISALPDVEKPVNLSPSQITMRFMYAVQDLGLNGIRFHDLRHYAASMMHAMGIPDAYIMKRGGWETDSTLKRIYRGTMDDYERKYTNDLIKKIGSF